VAFLFLAISKRIENSIADERAKLVSGPDLSTVVQTQRVALRGIEELVAAPEGWLNRKPR
jgi:hypothetical protein